MPQVSANGHHISLYPVTDRGLYDVRVRYVAESGLCGNWTTREKVYVYGQTAPPPDIKTLWLDHWKTLRWPYPNPPKDHKGFVVRMGYGTAVVWDSATDLYGAPISDTQIDIQDKLSGDITFLVRAVDMSGNLSRKTASLEVDFGDYTPENIVVEKNLFEMKFPGSYLNMSRGDSGAPNPLWSLGDPESMWSDNDQDPMWDDDPLTIMWKGAYYPRASYTWFVRFVAGEIGSTLTFRHRIRGGAWHIEYRPTSYPWPGKALLESWASGESNDFWPASGEDLFKSALESWRPFPGSMKITEEFYEFRIVFESGYTQSWINEFAMILDVQEFTELVENCGVGPNGRRIPLRHDFTLITSVSITIQYGGTQTQATQCVVLDKDATTGPLVFVYDRYGNPASANIDALVKGY
jgi:hypothetical protein